MLDMLLFPIKNLCAVDFPIALSKELDAAWDKLFTALVREAALIATVDENQTIEDLCSKINDLLADDTFNTQVMFHSEFSL